MPFRSLAQLAKFAELVKQGKMSQEKFDEWKNATPDVSKLPERVTIVKPTGLQRIPKAKVIK